MNLLRRAIAVFVLMVFTPVSVLAGTPLRFCVGDDGHRAIEFVLTADHHDDAQFEQAAECLGASAEYVAPSSECTDSPLLSVSQKPNSQALLESDLTLDDLVAFALLAIVVVVPTLADAPKADLRPAHDEHREPRLDALRTVVLLI